MWRPHFVHRLGRVLLRAPTTGTCLSPASAAVLIRTDSSQCNFLAETGQSSRVVKQAHPSCSHMGSMLERGVYDKRVYQHVKGSDVKSLDVVSDGRLLSITWDDGKVSRFHSVWLHSACYCPACRFDHTGQPNIEFEKFAERSTIVSAVDDGGCLAVEWKEDPGHIGVFPLKFLKAYCYSKQSQEEKRNSIRMTFTTDNIIPRVSYDEVATTRRGLYKWLKALNETGLAIVEGVPCEEGMVKKVCQRIADQVQHTAYGETFDVKTVTQPNNAAYSDNALKLHMDQPMYESPPGIEALHCIKFDERITGGDNLFVDLFHVAETFREKYPEDFDVLCKIPGLYETVHYTRDWPIHMSFQRPIIAVNKHGDLTGILWHPHSVGPLQVEEEHVEPFYRAFGRFSSLINNFPYNFRHRLRPGELVAFNNRRFAHGRTAFINQAGERFLQGCYVEITEFKSCVQVLSNLEGEGRPAVRVGNFDCQ